MTNNGIAETLEIDSTFDVVIIGTNITNSLLSSGLSKSGVKTLIIEPTPEFGSSSASPSLESLQHLLEHKEYPEPSFQLKTVSSSIPKTELTTSLTIRNTPFTILHSKTSQPSPEFKNSILDLTPSPMLIKSTLLNFIVSSRLHNYMNFNCISNLYTLKTTNNQIVSIFNIPFDSESLIENRSLTRIQKYKLSKLISGNKENVTDKDISILSPFISTKRELKNVISSTKVYNIKNNSSNFNSLLNSKNTKDLEKTATPFIYPSYGFSEIVQGILRMTSFSQGNVICNVKLECISKFNTFKEDQDDYKYIIEANGAQIKAKQIVVSAAHLKEIHNTDKFNTKNKIDEIEYRLNFACSNIKNEKFKYTKNALEIFFIEKDENDKLISDIFMTSISSNTDRIKADNIMFQVCCSINIEITKNTKSVESEEISEIDKEIRNRIMKFLGVKENDLLFCNSFVYKINKNDIGESKMKEMENEGLFIVDNYCEYKNNEKLEDEMDKINDVFLKMIGKSISLFDAIKDKNNIKENLEEELNRLNF